MEITAKSLRNRVREALDCVERGESVLITYHGKPRARLVGIGKQRQSGKVGGEPAGFGMWKEHEDMLDVDAYVRGLRKPRHAG